MYYLNEENIGEDVSREQVMQIIERLNDRGWNTKYGDSLLGWPKVDIDIYDFEKAIDEICLELNI